MPWLPIEELRHREYWTPGEVARVLGRTPAYWVALFERGALRGYVENRHRRIEAASAREYLRELSERTCPKPVRVGEISPDAIRAYEIAMGIDN